VHDIIGAQHTIAGAQWSVVGATGLNTLGLILPEWITGAAEKLVMTSSNGYVRIEQIQFGSWTEWVGYTGGMLRLQGTDEVRIQPGGTARLQVKTTAVQVQGVDFEVYS